jgi:hypothetical protein
MLQERIEDLRGRLIEADEADEKLKTALRKNATEVSD